MERLDLSPLCVLSKANQRQVKALYTPPRQFFGY